MRPEVLEPTRKIVSGKLEHVSYFRAVMSIARHPLADVEVDVPADLHAAGLCVTGASQCECMAGASARNLTLRVYSGISCSGADVCTDHGLGPAAHAVGRWQHTHPALIMVFIDDLEWPDSHFT